jgi:hypothetical protein
MEVYQVENEDERERKHEENDREAVGEDSRDVGNEETNAPECQYRT